MTEPKSPAREGLSETAIPVPPPSPVTRVAPDSSLDKIPMPSPPLPVQRSGEVERHWSSPFPGMHSEDDAADRRAYSEVSAIIPQLITAIWLTLCSSLHMLSIVGQFVLAPYDLWRRRKYRSKPLWRYELYSFVALAVVILISFLPFTSTSSILNFIARQKYYKMWSLFNVIAVVILLAPNIQRRAHRVLRGAVRVSEGWPIVAIVLKVIANFYSFLILALMNACYVGGQWSSGKGFSLILSAVLHIEIVLLKKTMGKFTGQIPAFAIGEEMMMVIFGVVFQCGIPLMNPPPEGKDKGSVLLYVGFHAFFALLRFVLIMITEDGANWVDSFVKSELQLRSPQHDVALEESNVGKTCVEGWFIMFASLLLTRSHWWLGILSLLGLAGIGFLYRTPWMRRFLAVPKKEKGEKVPKSPKKKHE